MTEDRIRALPDDLLVTILLRIPTKEAVATMILSKRWLFIWTMLPVLEYKDDDDDAEDVDDDDDDDDDDADDDDDEYDGGDGDNDNIEYDDGGIGDGKDEESKKSVWLFLNKSMELHKASLLSKLTIKLGPRCPTDANVCKWLETAVNRGVRVLTFELQWSADPTRLPESLYTCKTLVLLNLSHKIIVDLPSSSCLPRLTMLELHYVVYKDEASLVTFLSSCPVLEALWVKRIKDDNVANFIVKVPSLLFLNYESYKPSTDEYDEVDNGRSLVVDTPALTQFCISNHSRGSFLIESLPCLEDAFIKGNYYVPDIGSYRYFKSLSNVLYLDLFLTDEMVVRFSDIKFSRLIKCNLIPCNSDWMDSLVFLLHNTPKLKHFIVDYRFTSHPPIASATWMKRSYEIPESLSTSLEEFKVLDYKGREEEQELVEYFLVYSKCLKKAEISFEDTVKDKDTMKEELEAIPRLSIHSQLLFNTEA